MERRSTCFIFLAFLSIYQVESAINEDAVAKAMSDKLSSILESPSGGGGVFSGISGVFGTKSGVIGRRFNRGPTKVDLMFVLDSSGSIGSSNFEAGKRASKTIVDFVDNKAASISSVGSRVGLVEFSEPRKTHVEFTFGTHNSVSAVKGAIGRVRYDSGGSTATAQALKLAKTEFDNRGKLGHAKLIWTVTDGRYNTGENPKITADILKRKNTAMCVVGVGRSIDDRKLRDIADSDCVFKVDSWVQYERVAMKAFGVEAAPKLGSGFFDGIRFS